MQSADIPVRIPTPFGDSAVEPTYRHQVPEDSQIGITDGAASFETGFPPLNFTDVGAGGVPPFGNDFNGLLYQMTQWLRWTQAGGIVPWDSTFVTAIGGYPFGAIVASATTAKKFWVSTAEDNTEDPDVGTPTQWEAFYVGNSGATAGTYRRGVNVTADSAGRVTGIANAAVPQQIVITTPGSGTYNTPTNATRLRILLSAGGAGSGSTGGTAGGNSSFNSVTAIGGSVPSAVAGAFPGQGGNGGDGGIGTGTIINRRPGGPGHKGCVGEASGSPVGGIVNTGGAGGDSIFGSGPRADEAATVPGTGGGGISVTNATVGPGAANGGGGGGEGYEMWIYAPTTSYSYTVGAAGLAGSNGLAGAPGKIVIEAYFD